MRGEKFRASLIPDSARMIRRLGGNLRVIISEEERARFAMVASADVRQVLASKDPSLLEWLQDCAFYISPRYYEAD